VRVSRRQLLKSAGVTLALPWLEAHAASATAAPPRRMVCICAPLSFHAPFLVPQAAGKEYAATPYLEVLKELREDYTVISGLAHPEVGNAHDSIYSFLTGAPHPEIRAGFRNAVSMDQLAAERIGGETRYASLPLSCEGFGLSWTRSGALVPSDSFPSSVFRRLFVEGRPDEVQDQIRRLREGQSILDGLGAPSRRLRAGLGARDREKLDEYFTSVRELEVRLHRAEEWSKRPKPKVDVPPPQDNNNPADGAGKARLMYDLTHLALQTDSTRIVTLLLMGTSLVPPIPGVSFGHHDLSHHGQDPTKIAQLRAVELVELTAFRDFVAKLKQTKEGSGSLLDSTMVFFSSNLGNAATHSVRSLPVLLAGGGFRHGHHLAFDPVNPPPLCNLYVSMLQRLGVGVPRFGSSTGTLKGLES
jgi:hypothetical protein